MNAFEILPSAPQETTPKKPTEKEEEKLLNMARTAGLRGLEESPLTKEEPLTAEEEQKLQEMIRRAQAGEFPIETISPENLPIKPEVLEQLKDEAQELATLEPEAAKTTTEKINLINKFKKSATVLMLSLSLFAAGGTFEKAQAGSNIDFGRIANDVLRGVGRGVSKGASRTMERAFTKGEDQLKYERQRDKIFNQYLQMMRKNPAAAERFLQQSMQNLDQMYGRQ